MASSLNPSLVVLCDPDFIFLEKPFDSCIRYPDAQTLPEDQDINLEDFSSYTGLDGSIPPEPNATIQNFGFRRAGGAGDVTLPAVLSGRPLDQAAHLMPLGRPSILPGGPFSERENRIAHWLAGSTRLDPFHLLNIGSADNVWQSNRGAPEDLESTDTSVEGVDEAEIWSIDDESDHDTHLTSEMSW